MSISKQLINGFIESELELFKNQFEESPIPAIQEARSLSIAWICYYFKDSITNENSAAIIKFVDDVYVSENYRKHGWFRISALQAAAFILTADIHYANSLIQNIECEQSWARGYIIESASIICPLLSFNNKYLKGATETNIKYSHVYYEENVILYLSTKGEGDKKRNWLEHQLISDENEYHKEFFNELKNSGKLYKSGFFIMAFSKAKSYLIFRIFNQPILAKIDANLFEETEINFSELVGIERAHPLNDIYINLSFLNSDK